MCPIYARVGGQTVHECRTRRRRRSGRFTRMDSQRSVGTPQAVPAPPPDHGLLSAIRSDEATMNDVHYLQSVGRRTVTFSKFQLQKQATDRTTLKTRIVWRHHAEQIDCCMHSRYSNLLRSMRHIRFENGVPVAAVTMHIATFSFL